MYITEQYTTIPFHIAQHKTAEEIQHNTIQQSTIICNIVQCNQMED